MHRNSPPIAKKNEKNQDQYHWLRDPNWPNTKDPEILEYLHQENDYTESELSQSVQNTIFEELKGRMQEEDYSVPIKKGEYYYYSHIRKDQDYWTIARKKGSLNSPEEVLLDINKLAEHHKHFDLGSYQVSPNHQMIAYSVDINGSERYNLSVKDIKSGKILDSNVEDVMGSDIVWDENNEGFFYIPCGEFWRSDKVFYHKIGQSQNEDRLIYEEKDQTFSVNIRKSESRQFVFLGSRSVNATEYHFIDSKYPEQLPIIIQPRSDEHKYSPTHHGEYFYITTNDKGANFRIVKTLIIKPNQSNWVEYIPISHESISGFFAYQNHFVMKVRDNGLNKLKVIKIADKKIEEIKFPDPVYSVSLIQTPFEYNTLLYDYSSLKTPKSVIEFDLTANQSKVLKIQEIPSGFNSDNYQVERLWAVADDGVQIPISLIYNTNAKLDGSDLLYLYGYGSYGIPIDAGFRTSIFSLVDRGFIYAIAHIRGGGEFGEEWHNSAKLLKKRRTFDDFINCAESLIKRKYTSAKQIVIHGGSAGGMLIGACVNMRPELFHAAIAEVPFVDVFNTMMDESLPLTPGEFKEWGNPKEKQYHDYIKSYCPYQNIKKQDYPHILAIAGLNDPRTTYWEAAKWVASLRNTKSDNNLLLLKIDMDSGHAGSSGRFDHLKDIAVVFCFVLKVFDHERRIRYNLSS